jgi:hypothetical protein
LVGENRLAAAFENLFLFADGIGWMLGAHLHKKVNLLNHGLEHALNSIGIVILVDASIPGALRRVLYTIIGGQEIENFDSHILHSRRQEARQKNRGGTAQATPPCKTQRFFCLRLS